MKRTSFGGVSSRRSFFNKFIYFNWRLITLHYCIGFAIYQHVSKRVQNAVLGCSLKNNRMISVCFQGKPFNTTVIQVYALTCNAEEAEIELFYEDLQDLLELTPKKDIFLS